MADFAASKGSLAHLKSEIQQRLPGALLGRPNNGLEAERRSDELGKFADRLILIRRDLRSHESLLRMQPGDAHSAAGWAARHRLQDVLSVKKEAEDLAKLIDDLLRRNGLNAMQAASQFHELFENLEKSFSHAEVSSALKAGHQLHQTIGPVQEQGPAHMEPLAAFDTAVPFMTLACLMLRWAARTFRGGH